MPEEHRDASQSDAPLAQRIAEYPLPADAARARRVLSDIESNAAAAPELAELASLLHDDAVAKLLLGTIGNSNYLTMLCERDSLRLLRILHSAPEQHFAWLCDDLARAMAEAQSQDEAMRLLRLFKQEVALLVALCDLGGIWQVMTVTHVLSQAADAAVQEAVRFLFKQAALKGDWLAEDAADPVRSSGYFVIAMGKHGAFELNYSSDIDLIVFFDPSQARLRDGLETPTFFVKLTRDLVKLMQERTGDGYVFRTDLRLRPDPAATQVAISTNAALSYYESFGQNWERAALIKARVIAGDPRAGAQLLADLTPFIWRKYLDFAAISDIHAMKRQIHAFKGFGSVGVAGHNIKLGRGGIREIEFFVQTQQLIAGGRQEDLRIPATLDALQKLSERGWIKPDVQRELTSSYLFLRRIEHRLQMLHDEQTQTLPADEDGLRQLAMLSGFPDGTSFGSKLRPHLETVQKHYAALFEDDAGGDDSGANLVFSGEDDDPETIATLNSMGYTNAGLVVATARGWHRGRYAAVRSAKGREALTEMQPLLIAALAETADPDRALIAFDRFLENLPTGVQLFALLKANPSLMRLVADIMGSAPRLARILGMRRRVLDAVLDPGFFGAVPSDPDWARLIDAELGPLEDFQEILDRARVIGNEQMFLIGVRVLSQTINAGRAGGVYAALAERIIAVMQDKVSAAMVSAHGRVPDGAAAVIAMGKLGGHEMTAASDLDLILVYDYDRGAMETLGETGAFRPISPNQYYTRITQRLISALSAPTAQGRLYEVDLRLRPSGQKGPVATQLSSFIQYQMQDAWTWEHMALTRARLITGPASLRDPIEQAIRAVLTKRRDREEIAEDVREMRGRIEQEKGTSDIWDLSQVRGGILDLEFITQYLQLIHAADHPEVLDQNTYIALTKLAKAGLIDPTAAETLVEAANFMNNLTQVLRLCLDQSFKRDTALDGLKDLLCGAVALPDFQSLEGALRVTLDQVSAQFEALIQ